MVAAFPGPIVLCAVALTAGVVGALTLYAFTTETDFTWLGGILFILGAVLVICSIFVALFPSDAMGVLLSGLGVLILGLYLIYDTQLIAGKGGSAYQIDDYILAAMHLYVDIIQMFLYILQALGKK